MNLIRRIPKKAKRSTRWKSQKHANFVRSHACVKCDAEAPIEFAHVRKGSGAGMGQKPDDFRAVALCKTCHQRQHTEGEVTFWTGHNVEAIIEAFQRTSPAWRDIQAVLKERKA
jgi:hypothetical protein